MTSFDDWDTLVRQPLAYFGTQYPDLGLVDVLDVAVAQQADSSDKEALIALLIELASQFGIGKEFKGKDVLQQNKHDEDLQDVIYGCGDKNKLQTSQGIGNLLKQFVDRNVEGLVLRTKPKRVSGSLSYYVELTSDTHRNQIRSRPITTGGSGGITRMIRPANSSPLNKVG